MSLSLRLPLPKRLCSAILTSWAPHAVTTVHRDAVLVAAAPRLPTAAEHPLPARADVVVVGGGYTGMAAADELARRGRSVVVLEAERLGWGASSRNGGMVHPGAEARRARAARARTGRSGGRSTT